MASTSSSLDLLFDELREAGSPRALCAPAGRAPMCRVTALGLDALASEMGVLERGEPEGNVLRTCTRTLCAAPALTPAAALQRCFTHP